MFVHQPGGAVQVLGALLVPGPSGFVTLGSSVPRYVLEYVHVYMCTYVHTYVGVVCPGTPRLLAMGTAQTPGRAAAVYSGIKGPLSAIEASMIAKLIQQLRR